MPTKNKPKRYNRHRSPRVARRKRRLEKRITGGKRNRASRPKNKGAVAEVKTPEIKKTEKKEGE